LNAGDTLFQIKLYKDNDKPSTDINKQFDLNKIMIWNSDVPLCGPIKLILDYIENLNIHLDQNPTFLENDEI
jgi:hypothetical protein